MNILINCSNLNGGGGGQVADSICSYTNLFPQHHFTVVYPKVLNDMGNRINSYDNVESLLFNYPQKDVKSLLTGRNDFLDGLVKTKDIDCVLTVFGPMKWRPRCPHVCGFALPRLVIPESPFFKQLSFKQWLKTKRANFIDTFIFRHGTKHLFTENPYISERVKRLIKGSEVRTISNNYNQIYDHKELWKTRKLDDFDGISILTLSLPYPHKNLAISIYIAKILKTKYPDFKFRFVLSIKKEDFPSLDKTIEDCFIFMGRVTIEECPSVYEQCDIAFLPSLLECFSAMYAEAMKMGLPILTTDLPFAKGLCGDAALFYKPLSAEDAAEKLYALATNDSLKQSLISKGGKQLEKFDTSENRAKKLIGFCEDICL